MTTAIEIKSDVQAWLDGLWAHIQGRQEDYLAANDRYFQGLRSHTTTPADGEDTEPDQLSAAPNDQAESWADLHFSLPSEFPCEMQIDAYDGPDGPGYVVIARVSISGETWELRQQHGPEDWRARDWQQVS